MLSTRRAVLWFLLGRAGSRGRAVPRAGARGGRAGGRRPSAGGGLGAWWLLVTARLLGLARRWPGRAARARGRLLRDDGRHGGRIALVTGGGTGIGRARRSAWPRGLPRGGGRPPARAAGGDRGPPRRRRRHRGRPRQRGGRAADGGETIAAFGRLDVLVNNAAAIRRNVPVHEVTVERWDEQLTVNLRGPFLVARAALRAMLDGEGDRAIVNVSSTLAHKASPGVAPYSAAKAGVLALTRSIAIEYGEHGIRCNAVCPDIVETPLAEVDRPNWPAHARASCRRAIRWAASASRTTSPARSPTWPRPTAWVSGIVVDVAGGITAL